MVVDGSPTLAEWRKYFPYETPRKIQSDVLDRLVELWDQYDVFVIQAPTAFGKSALAKCLMNALHSVSYITPTNQLVNQFREEFLDTPTLARMDSYYCEEWMRPCPAVRSKVLKYCKGCQCGKDISVAKFRGGPGVYNYHIYNAHKLYRDVLVVDEAHNLIPYIQGRMATRLWQHNYGYPSNAWTNSQLLDWFLTLPDRKQKLKKESLLYDALTMRDPYHVVRRTTELYNGKGTVRGEPEERDCIELLPVDISNAPKFLWPNRVRKIILMSATIGERDLEMLGLGRRGVVIGCDSPIPPDRRPILVNPITSVNRGNIEFAADELITHIENAILPMHEGEKGVIHATYQLSNLLRKYSKSPRFLYHTRIDKAEVYQQFLKSDPSQGRVLVACGMYEGIDLPEDLGRFQVIAKIPWLSLGNPAIKYRVEADPEWYLWETMKVLIQACGRICRTERDFGTTYLLDSSFDRLYNEGQHLMPHWFLDALRKVN